MCTRVFWNTNGVARTVGRCMDWAVSDEPVLWFVPRGTARDGHGDATSLSWTSMHASVAVSMWGIGTVDGLNERGLAAHALYLEPEDVRFPEPDARPSVAHAMWVQYLLDTDSVVEFPAVPGVVNAFDSIVSPVELALEQEKRVTEQVNGLLRTARRAARLVPFHRIFHSIEMSLLILAAAVVDLFVHGLATQVLLLAMLASAVVTVVGHLVAVLGSSRLR